MRSSFWGAVVIIGVLALSLTVIDKVVTPERIKKVLEGIIAEQTGGAVTIGSVDFSVTGGIVIEDVSFSPSFTAKPILEVEKIEYRYSLTALWAGIVNLKALKITKPKIYIEKDGDKFNFTPILEYRNAKFPQLSESPPPPPPPAVRKPDGTPLMGMSLADISLPLTLIVGELGLEELAVEYSEKQGDRLIQKVELKGLTALVSLSWKGKDSLVRVWVDTKKELTLVQYLKNQITPHLKTKLYLGAGLSLYNFSALHIDLGLRVKEFENGALTFTELPLVMRVRGTSLNQHQTLRFDEAWLEALSTLSYNLSGNIKIFDANLDRFTLDLAQNLKIDLAELNKLTIKVLKDVQFFGAINLSEFVIKGDLGVRDLTPLPDTKLKLSLEDLSAKAKGLTVSPINALLAFDSSASDGGAEGDLTFKFKLPGVAYQDLKSKFSVENLALNLNSKVLWPALATPKTHLALDIKSVRVEGGNMPKIALPLNFELLVDGQKDLTNAGFDLNFGLSDLMTLHASGRCKNECTENHVSSHLEVAAFSKVLAFLRPIVSDLAPDAKLPDVLRGKLDFALALDANIPPPLKTTPDAIIKQAKVQVGTEIDLKGIFLKGFGVNLEDQNLRLAVNGTHENQRIDLDERFNTLSLNNGKINVHGFRFNTAVENRIDGPLDLKMLLKQIVTKIAMNLRINEVALTGALPLPIKDLSFDLNADQTHVEELRLSLLQFTAPSFGANVRSSGKISLSSDFKPQQTSLELAMEVKGTADQAKVSGIETTGSLNFNTSLAVTGSELVDVNSKLIFNDFNLKIPGKDGGSGIEVSKLNGEIPLSQKIRIPTVKELSQKVANSDQKAEDDGILTVSTVSADDMNSSGAVEVQAKEFVAALEKNKQIDAYGMSRVDYGQVRPFYEGRKPITVSKVSAANIDLSDLEFDMELKQSLFAINDFLINVLGGKIQGGVQFAFEPSAAKVQDIPKELKTTLHITRLDTRKLLEKFPNLKNEAESDGLFSNPYIDATVHFTYDLSENDMSGNIEITSIGKDQLKMLLYYVDPYGANKTITDIRRALSLGEVRHVSIPIKNGDVGLGVDIRLLSAPIPTPKLSKFPISQIVGNLKSQSSN